MIAINPPFEIAAPYIHPQNWDGNRIGIDTPEMSEPVVDDHHARRVAKQALVGYFEHAHSYWPTRVYREGQQFDVNDHPEGTIVLFQVDSLHARFAPEGYEFPSDLTLPPRPDALRDFSEFEAFAYGGIIYTSLLRWGVTTANRRSERALLTVPFPADTTRPLAHGKLRLHDKPNNTIASSFVIGQTFSPSLARRHPEETYVRVNALEVCGEARKEPPGGGRRLSFAGMLGDFRPAFGNI
jgi:hypothetical protein